MIDTQSLGNPNNEIAFKALLIFSETLASLLKIISSLIALSGDYL